MACGLDRIVVLDVTHDYPQGCVCAFDVKGNPVHCFACGAWLSGLNPEGSAGVVLVDLSVESKGYLYVLKYLQPVSGRVGPDDYRLDVYNPDGSFLTQVAGLAAARLQVDLWRNVFTVNYEILPDPGVPNRRSPNGSPPRQALRGPEMTDMQPINQWVLYYQGRVVRPRPDLGLGFCPYLVDPPGTPQPPSPTVTVNYVGAEGILVLTCQDGYAGNCQPVEPRYPAGVVFEDVSSSYHLRPLPTGDGSFILGRADPSFPSGNNYLGYVVVRRGPHIPYDWLCLSLDVQAAQAARFTASGLDRASILDCVQVSLDANGMTFAGVDVTKADLSGSNLSGCDFRHVAGGSFGSCSVAGSHLQGASFSGLPMAGLQMSWSDCTGADFTGCDFTSMQTGGELPPVMAGADLTGAVIPAGIPLGKTRDGVGSFAGALLANATLTGADLAGADLSGADLSGTGVSVFSPAFESSQGINDYDLLGEADRVIAHGLMPTRPTPRRTTGLLPARVRRVRHPRQDHRRQRQRHLRPRLFSGRPWRRHRWLQPAGCGRPDDRVRLRQHRQPRPSRLLPARRRAHGPHREEDGRPRHRHVRQGMGLDERYIGGSTGCNLLESRRPDHRLRLRRQRPPRPFALLPPRNLPRSGF